MKVQVSCNSKSQLPLIPNLPLLLDIKAQHNRRPQNPPHIKDKDLRFQSAQQWIDLNQVETRKGKPLPQEEEERRALEGTEGIGLVVRVGRGLHTAHDLDLGPLLVHVPLEDQDQDPTLAQHLAHEAKEGTTLKNLP